MNTLKPDYYELFECTANLCEDHCCHGWKVPVDKLTFYKYRNIKGEVGKNINLNVNRNRNNKDDSFYAKIKMNESENCPFLDNNKLCKIHSDLGEDYLSYTCKTYPRKKMKYNTLTELGLSISCPEVAKKVILKKEKITFTIDNVEEEAQYYSSFYTIEKKLYDFVLEIRSGIITILQLKEIPVWKRLSIIMMMCNKVQPYYINSNFDECYIIVDDYLTKISDSSFVNSLDEMLTLNHLKVPIISSIIKCINSNNDINFSNLKEHINVLLNKDETNKDVDVFNRYSELEKLHFNRYILENEHIFENYLVYYIYTYFIKEICNKDIYGTVVKMAINYSVLKMLTIGSLAYYGDEFKERNIIDIFYRFSRKVEHNKNFLDLLYEEFKDNGYDELAYILILVK